MDELFLDPKVVGKSDYQWLAQKLAEERQKEVKRLRPLAHDGSDSGDLDGRPSTAVAALKPGRIAFYKRTRVSDIRPSDIKLTELPYVPGLPGWKRRALELKAKLGCARWEPKKRVARSTMDKICFLHREMPEVWTIEKLSQQFRISFESVRRIIKSKFVPSKERLAEMEQRHKRLHREYRLSLLSKNKQQK
ncbi:hypothetical protein EV182_000500 [Spiromyces aspiralis]|uniref:Uncharacterized protein n=1 Tax=Spiromyces aspiralis TaxID=68401 RepID=A0ACC1HUC9_9FUNG|nr:hypothetical protein EV182_000500 [Spiromyces aspiralis]